MELCCDLSSFDSSRKYFLEAEQLVPASAELILMMALGAALGPIITSFVRELIEQGSLITCGCICILTGGFVGFRIFGQESIT